MTAIVILAAGSSSRMGKPKQNLIFRNKTLLQHTITEAKLVTAQVIIILGANKDDIEPTVEGLNAKVLLNKDWEVGMASSIILAIEYFISLNTKIDGIIFLLCDQPHIDASLLNKLITMAESSEKGITASAYRGTIGVPAYFKERYFPELLKLNGQEGAKKLIEKFSDDLQTIPFPSGGIDIDTPEDFEKLIREGSIITGDLPATDSP